MSSSRPDPPRTSAAMRGFSLLEVLVAFVIVALVATSIFRLFSGALGNAGAAEEYSRATLIAQSVQAETLGNPLHEGTQTGSSEDGRVQWTVQVAPYDAPNINPDIARASEFMPFRMYRIVTSVSVGAANGTSRNVTLATIRVGAKDTVQ